MSLLIETLLIGRDYNNPNDSNTIVVVTQGFPTELECSFDLGTTWQPCNHGQQQNFNYWEIKSPFDFSTVNVNGFTGYVWFRVTNSKTAIVKHRFKAFVFNPLNQIKGVTFSVRDSIYFPRVNNRVNPVDVTVSTKSDIQGNSTPITRIFGGSADYVTSDNPKIKQWYFPHVDREVLSYDIEKNGELINLVFDSGMREAEPPPIIDLLPEPVKCKPTPPAETSNKERFFYILLILILGFMLIIKSIKKDETN